MLIKNFIAIRGNNTVTGNLSSIPNATTVVIWGANTVTGNLSSIPNATYINIAGNNTISDYTTTVLSSSKRFIYLKPVTGYGLSSEEVDTYLIDLATYVTTWTNEKIIDLRGNNAPRTSASDSAIAILTSRGVTVYTN